MTTSPSTSTLPPNNQTTAPGPTSDSVTPTLLSSLSALVQSSIPRPTSLAHPYAPALHPLSTGRDWKGKSRDLNLSLTEQEDALRGIKAGLEGLRGVLETATLPQGLGQGKEDGRIRMMRAFKEVITHQSALLPLLPSLSPDSSATLRERLPSSLQPPLGLLRTLAQQIGIETYLEDSQFGLLKTTLTLAGKRFVLDIDLETDAAEGEGDDVDEDTALVSGSAPVPGGTSAGAGGDQMKDRGRVKLSKLGFNHVTSTGGTGKSEHICRVMRYYLEAYLGCWNAGESAEGWKGVVEGLAGEMSHLKWLDCFCEIEGGDRDWFQDLEEIKGLVSGATDEQLIFPSEQTIFPSFKLLPDGQPILRLRPMRRSEDIRDSNGWLIEVVPSAEGVSGVVVRRDWLSGVGQDGLGLEEDGAIKVEQLLYTQRASAFPYGSEFVHAPKSGGLQQRWSMVTPGPSGFVVGRIGWDGTKETLERLVKVIRHQIRLNRLLTEVSDPSHLEVSAASGGVEPDDEDSDDELEDLSLPAAAIPITLSHTSEGFVVTLPLPHSPAPFPPTVRLDIRPAQTTTNELEIKWTLPNGDIPDDALSARLDSGLGAMRQVDSISPSLIQALSLFEQDLGGSS